MKLATLSVLAALALTSSAWAASSSKPGVVLKPGQHRTFTATALRSGSKIACVDQGHTLSVTIPTSPSVGSGTVWVKPGTQRFYLNVNVNADRSSLVRCGLGGVHW